MKGTQMHLFSSEESEKAQDKRHSLVMPLDTTILLLVVGILLLALSFSLGVEKGRRNAMRTLEKERAQLAIEREKTIAAQREAQEAATLPTTQQQFFSTQEQLPTPTAPIVVQRPITVTLPETTTVVTETPQPRPAGSKKYVIQVASYAGKDQAETAAKKLRQEGYPAFVAQKGKFLAILVGEFKDEKTAKNNLESLKRKYKDCILKKI